MNILPERYENFLKHIIQYVADNGNDINLAKIPFITNTKPAIIECGYFLQDDADNFFERLQKLIECGYAVSKINNKTLRDPCGNYHFYLTEDGLYYFEDKNILNKEDKKEKRTQDFKDGVKTVVEAGSNVAGAVLGAIIKP